MIKSWRTGAKIRRMLPRPGLQEETRLAGASFNEFLYDYKFIMTNYQQWFFLLNECSFGTATISYSLCTCWNMEQPLVLPKCFWMLHWILHHLCWRPVHVIRQKDMWDEAGVESVDLVVRGKTLEMQMSCKQESCIYPFGGISPLIVQQKGLTIWWSLLNEILEFTMYLISNEWISDCCCWNGPMIEEDGRLLIRDWHYLDLFGMIFLCWFCTFCALRKLNDCTGQVWVVRLCLRRDRSWHVLTVPAEKLIPKTSMFRCTGSCRHLVPLYDLSVCFTYCFIFSPLCVRSWFWQICFTHSN